jgi:hypothetical protein
VLEPKAFFSIGPQGYPFGLDTLYVKGSSRINFDELGSADVGVAWKETQTFDVFDVSIDLFSVTSVSSNGRYFTFYSSTAEEASGLRSNDLVRIASFAVSD